VLLGRSSVKFLADDALLLLSGNEALLVDVLLLGPNGLLRNTR